MTPLPCQSRSKSDRTGVPAYRRTGVPLGGRPRSAKRTLETTQMGGKRTFPASQFSVDLSDLDGIVSSPIEANGIGSSHAADVTNGAR